MVKTTRHEVIELAGISIRLYGTRRPASPSTGSGTIEMTSCLWSALG